MDERGGVGRCKHLPSPGEEVELPHFETLGTEAQHQTDAEPIAVRFQPRIGDRVGHRAEHHLFESGKTCESVAIQETKSVRQRGNLVHHSGELVASPRKLIRIDRPNPRPPRQQAVGDGIEAVAQRRYGAQAGDHDRLTADAG